MTKTFWVIVGAAVMILVVWFAVGSEKGVAPASPAGIPTEEATPAPNQSGTVPQEQSAAGAASVTVTYTDGGFSPATVTIAKGGKVDFVNNSSRGFWPASDPHPQHTGYPEAGTCKGHAFDPCGAVAPGATWSFTFTTSGTWEYHNHMSARHGGKVVVVR
jgi:plastocyanin